MRWQKRSVRVRLACWYGAALTLVLLVYAVSVYTFLERQLSRELDRQVHDDYEAAESNLEAGPEGVIQWRKPLDEPEDELDTDRWIEVRSLSGGLIHRRSPALHGRAWIDLPALPPGQAGPVSTALASGERVRIYEGQHRVADRLVVIRAARTEAHLERGLRQLAVVLMGSLPLAVALASLGGYLMARRVLSPLAVMVQKARRITAERLHERLPVENPDDELGQLAVTFNGAFARLERSFEELRRFTADASHELRTPLAALRAVGEAGVRESETPEALRDVIGSMLEEADCLGRLVETLLELARAEGGRVVLNRQPVDLWELAEDAASLLGVLAEERSQRISLEGQRPLLVCVDRLVLRRAVINMLDNAIKYSPTGSVIRLVMEQRAPHAELAIADAGPGIAPAHQVHVFERFYRVDRARSREAGGFGLGLAIARWAVEAHGGSIVLESAPGSGSTFRIRLPAESPTPGQAP